MNRCTNLAPSRRNGKLSPALWAAICVVLLVPQGVFAEEEVAVQIGGTPPPAKSKATSPYVPSIVHPEGLTILFNGSRNGKLEPCGCRARNLGGVDKEAGVIEAFRKATSATLALDAGHFLRQWVDANMRLQMHYLLQALGLMRYDAINVGYSDLTHGMDFLRQAGAEMRLPLISCNILDGATKRPVFDTHKVFDLNAPGGRKIRVGVIGVTAPNDNASHPESGVGDQPKKTSQAETDVLPSAAMTARSQAILREVPGGGTQEESGQTTMTAAMKFAVSSDKQTKSARYEIADEIASVRPIAEKLRPECQVLVLLDLGGMRHARKIAETIPLFDVVVAGDYFMRGQPEYIEDPKARKKVLLIAPEHEGKFVGQIEVGIDAAGKATDVSGKLIPLDQHITSDPKLSQLMQEYSVDASRIHVDEPATTQSLRIFAGANRCQSCHKAEYTQWKQTKHSRAMPTLVEKKMQFNPDCVRCHTVAYGSPGGYTDLRVTPFLSNVQCESCHGPALKHVEEETKAAKLPEADKKNLKKTSSLRTKFDALFCKQCHDAENDPSFDFDLDIKHVIHTSTEPKRTRPTTGSVSMRSQTTTSTGK